MPRSLFRQEAIDAQRERFLGEAGVAQPVRMWVYTATACAIALIAIAVAVWGQYTRRERVQGYLTSAVGRAEVRTPDAGTITDIVVHEGDAIPAGATMARLSIDRSGVDDATGYEAIVVELERQRDLLTQERAQATRLGQQQIEQLKSRIGSLNTEIQAVGVQLELQRQRLAQSKALLDKWLENQAKGFASEYYLIRYQSEAKDQEIKVQELERARTSSQKELVAARAELPSTELLARTRVDQIDQSISAKSQAIADQRLRHAQDVKREMLITAPIDGTVTNIAFSRGQTVAENTRFATMLPKNGELHAELLVPTRAVGFVKPGQPVMLRYEAFPYERFGQYGGKVENVGRDIWSEGDAVGPLSVREPVYRIVVDLERQDIASGGDHVPLRAGMIVSADLLMEKRSLLEWLFQPVLQLQKRLVGAPMATS